MSRSFRFAFGKASDLSARQLTVYEITGEAVVIYDSVYAGSAEESLDVELNAGRFKAVILDTRDNGSSRHRGGAFDGLTDWPKQLDEDFYIMSAEEASSSSSSASSSSSSSSSLSSSSSSLSSLSSSSSSSLSSSSSSSS